MAIWSGVPILGDVIDIVGGELQSWRRRREERLQTELTLEKAKQASFMKRAEKEQDHEISWDIEMAKGSQSSWKDEWLVLVFSIPLIGCFIPGASDWVLTGFAVLEETPDWYTYTLSVIVAATFGVRSVIGQFTKGKRR